MASAMTPCSAAIRRCTRQTLTQPSSTTPRRWGTLIAHAHVAYARAIGPALPTCGMAVANPFLLLQGSPELNPGGLPYGFFYQPAGRLPAGYPLVFDTHLSAKRAEQAITYIRDGGYLSETVTKWVPGVGARSMLASAAACTPAR